ncbi:MAG: DUF2867 domain-containing protein [Desulforhopalus sp.]
MVPWARVGQSEYLSLDLRAHTILKDIPIHDVWRLDLPGGGAGRTVSDVRALLKANQPDGIVRLLFSARWLLGRLFGWDRKSAENGGLFQHRITEADKTLSTVAPGTKEGPFTVLYVHSVEAMTEIRNRTVHAALVWVVFPRAGGYRLLWAIYVKPVGRITALYMLLIEPFRRWIVYPSLLRQLYHSWRITYNSSTP